MKTQKIKKKIFKKSSMEFNSFSENLNKWNLLNCEKKTNKYIKIIYEYKTKLTLSTKNPDKLLSFTKIKSLTLNNKFLGNSFGINKFCLTKLLI